MRGARAKFVYLFKNFQCVLSYPCSSLATKNINGLLFHLVQQYLQKLSVMFFSRSVYITAYSVTVIHHSLLSDTVIHHSLLVAPRGRIDYGTLEPRDEKTCLRQSR